MAHQTRRMAFGVCVQKVDNPIDSALVRDGPSKKRLLILATLVDALALFILQSPINNFIQPVSTSLSRSSVPASSTTKPLICIAASPSHHTRTGPHRPAAIMVRRLTNLTNAVQSVSRACHWVVATRARRRWIIRLALGAFLFPLFLQWVLAYILGSDARLLPPELLKAKNLLIVTAHPDDECLFFSPSILGVLDRNKDIKGGLVVMSTGMSSLKS